MDDHATPLDRLDKLVEKSARYNRIVSAFERALDGEAKQAAIDIDAMTIEEADVEPDQATWRAAILALAGREDAAARAGKTAAAGTSLSRPIRQLAEAGLVDAPELWRRLLPPQA